MAGLPDHVLRRLGRARARIHEGHADPLTLEALARAANMSPFHFLRVFKATFGRTPGQYLTETRIDHARELLARGVSVTEACHEVGFSSLGSFSASFRRRFGQSPRDLQVSVRAFGQVPARIFAVRVPFCFVARYAPMVALPRPPA